VAERAKPFRYAIEVLVALLLVLAIAGLAAAVMGVGGGASAGVFAALVLMFAMPWWAVLAGFKIPGYFVVVILAVLVNVALVAGYALPRNIGRIIYLFLAWGIYLVSVAFVLSFFPPMIA
jgi:hypothetical protein